MQTPEKILGKKFVRGKPYYKIKWEGLSKDQSTWQSPASLIQNKSMINKYQVKNWGSPLDQKFFNLDIYRNKGFANRKTPDKKTVVNRKKNQKKKVEQRQPSQIQSAAQQNSSLQQDQQQQIKPKITQLQKNRPYKRKNRQEKNIPAQQQLQIIDLDGEIPKKIQKKTVKSNNQINQPKESETKDIIVQKEKENKKKEQSSNSINIEELDRKKKNIQIMSSNDQVPLNDKQYTKDLGLTLPVLQVILKNNQKIDMLPTSEQKKKLTLSSVVHIEIEPTRTIHQIVHIHHLQKINLGNHLYLIEYNDKQMKKMTTAELLQKHPLDFVSFLQRKYKLKSTPT